MASMSSLCRLLNIEHPIIQSGMGRVAGPELTAGVSRAGALGILAGLNLSPDDLRTQIRRVRELTDRPFGVNQWLHPELQTTVDPASVSPEAIAQATAALNEVRREIGLPESASPPERRPDTIARNLDVVLEERVPVWSIGLGLPTRDMVARCRERGVRIMVMVANVADACEADASGADVIAAQGREAGGHRSTWRRDAPDAVGTFALVPEVVDAVRVPVVAAGGIADGRGVIAALALGASGVLMGTRFVATRESTAPEFWKQRILRASSDATVVTTAFTGLAARVLRSKMTDAYASSGAPVLPGLLQSSLQQDIWGKALTAQDGEYYPLYAGQSVGIIHDVPPAADVVAAIVKEARDVRRSLERISL